MGYHALALDYRGMRQALILLLFLLSFWKSMTYIIADDLFRYFIDFLLGYGDSGGIPFEEIGPISDAVTLFLYVRSYAPHQPLIFWGSSLGAA